MNMATFERRLAKVETALASNVSRGVPETVSDFSAYAPAHLKIRTKTGGIDPFVFNRAQLHIHSKLEEQKAATGKVRALILKGRQQGCSTYVAGRFYHRVTHAVGLRCFILTHEDAATQNLLRDGQPLS